MASRGSDISPSLSLVASLALDLGTQTCVYQLVLTNGLKPTGSRGDTRAPEANHRFMPRGVLGLVSLNRYGVHSTILFYLSSARRRPYPVSCCCCCRVLFLRRRLVRSRYKPVCRTLGTVVVPGDPLYQLVVLLSSFILTLNLTVFREETPRIDVFQGPTAFSAAGYRVRTFSHVSYSYQFWS